VCQSFDASCQLFRERNNRGLSIGRLAFQASHYRSFEAGWEFEISHCLVQWRGRLGQELLKDLSRRAPRMGKHTCQQVVRDLGYAENVRLFADQFT